MLVSNKILMKRIFTHEKMLRFKVKKTTIKNTYKPFLNNTEPRNERAGARNQVVEQELGWPGFGGVPRWKDKSAFQRV